MIFDLIIIIKQTELERYNFNIQNSLYSALLNSDPNEFEFIKNSHEIHLKTKDLLENYLQKENIKYIIYNLDELANSNYSFFNISDEKSGIKTKLNTVISLGGDGTLLHSSHYVNNTTKLIGVNSCPNRSIGHLCSLNYLNMQYNLLNAIYDQNNYVKINRLHTKTNNKINIPLALNDILLCHAHPAASSRYKISIKSNEFLSEKHISSGVWISTSAGSTAAISAYNKFNIPLIANKILVAIRELYLNYNSNFKIINNIYDTQNTEITITSYMKKGLFAIDGPDFSYNLNFGEEVHISSPDNASLLLYKNNTNKIII